MTEQNFSQEIEAAAQAGDPPADKLVSVMIDQGEVAGVNELFRTINTLKPGMDYSQLPPRLADFMREAEADPPGWTEADTKAAEGFFAHHHGEASMLQGTVGLIGTYLSPTGAYTLRSTGRLGGVEGPGRRLSQSTRLFQGMGDKGAMRDGTLKATVTKVRLVHASVRQLHEKSNQWDYKKWGMPVSQKYTTGATCVFSVQILQAMRNLGIDVSHTDAEGFMCAWHYVNHYLGVPERFQLPKDVDLVDRLWSRERQREWQKTDDGVFMTRQAVTYYKGLVGNVPGVTDAFIAMVRQALTDTYADMAGVPSSPFDIGAKLAAGGNKALGGIGGMLGGATKKVTGIDPREEAIGAGSKVFNKVLEDAVTHDKDRQPQMHQELNDGR